MIYFRANSLLYQTYTNNDANANTLTQDSGSAADAAASSRLPQENIQLLSSYTPEEIDT